MIMIEFGFQNILGVNFPELGKPPVVRTGHCHPTVRHVRIIEAAFAQYGGKCLWAVGV